MKKAYISDILDITKVKEGTFNLISAGCGTGKSYFVFTKLLQHYPDVLPNEVLFITSRSLTVKQQANMENMIEFTGKEKPVIQMWNGEDVSGEEIESGIRIMTYDKIIRILKDYSSKDNETLINARLIIFDECHTLFCDTFIGNIDMLKVWIQMTLRFDNKLIFGLTATPEAVFANEKASGIKINSLLAETLIKYRAKQLVCTDDRSIAYLLHSKFGDGKTLIMCNSVKAAFSLKSRIENSAVLVSKFNNKFTPEMDKIREYIADNETFPPTFTDTDGKVKELKVLIATSTAREGYNLRENSGVKNIVCYYGDSMNITQIAGRARYEIDNLIIVKGRAWYSDKASQKMLKDGYEEFCNYLENPQDDTWFRTVQHLVQHDFGDVQIFTYTGDKHIFRKYIEDKWLLDKNAAKQEIKARRIWRQEDKDEIVKMALNCHIIRKDKSKIKFLTVMREIENTLGYEVVDKVFKIQGKQIRCKLIFRGE